MSDIGIDQSYGPYSLKHAAINKLFSLGLELAQINKVARYALNSTMALTHYNPTSTNEKALQLLSSTNSIEISPIQLEKNIAKTDEKLRKEIYRISKTAWHDFVGEGFEIENGVLGLERDVYLSIVKFLNSHTLRKYLFIFLFVFFIVHWH
jgi:hypothetical protein